MFSSDDLFGPEAAVPRTTCFAPGAWQLSAFAVADAPELLAAVEQVIALSPWRRVQTPGGFFMSVSMSNCGELGWVSDRRGYRYQRQDPQTGRDWPAMPPPFMALASRAAAAAGYAGFLADACLINRYEPGARMSLHQDKNERDFSQPIVSVSLGLPAVFMFGGDQREDPTLKLPLQHGDVVVWGGPTRLRFHGVNPVKPGVHALLGEQRINLTFRRAG